MQKGTEPLVILNTIAGIVSQVIVFFSFYWVLKKLQLDLVTLLGLSILAPVIGGLVWQRLCKLNGWLFHLGGQQNEPYGIYAFIWGVVTMLPVIFSVRLVTSEYKQNSIAAVGSWFISKEFLLIFVYVLLVGICSLFFYGIKRQYSIRTYISSLNKGFEITEQIIIILWSLFLSIIPTLAILFLGWTYTPVRDTVEVFVYLLPTIITVISCLLALATYFGTYNYIEKDREGEVRGIIAGLTVRFALFWGLWLSIDIHNLRIVLKPLEEIIVRKF